MSGFEWFLLVVVVILVPLVVAVAVTLWTLEQARQRKRQNREVPADGAPVKRRATRDDADPAVAAPVAASDADRGADAGSSDSAGGDSASTNA